MHAGGRSRNRHNACEPHLWTSSAAMLRTLCRPMLLSRRKIFGRDRRPGDDRRSEMTEPRSLSTGETSTYSANCQIWCHRCRTTLHVPMLPAGALLPTPSLRNNVLESTKR